MVTTEKGYETLKEMVIGTKSVSLGFSLCQITA